MKEMPTFKGNWVPPYALSKPENDDIKDELAILLAKEGLEIHRAIDVATHIVGMVEPPKGAVDFANPKNWKEFKNDSWSKKKRTVWVNFYPSHHTGYVESYCSDTRAGADEAHRIYSTDNDNPNRIGNRAYPVEIEE